MDVKQQAIDTLYGAIGTLPGPDGSPINLLPFAVDSPGTNALKKMVCEAIVTVLEPWLMKPQAPVDTRTVSVNCRVCSTNLLTVSVDPGGVANVPATAISALAKMSPDCPHKPLTLDDQRRLIEQALEASE